MKRQRLLAIAGIVSLLVIGVSTFWYFHPTHFAYNDRFVLGSTKAQIQERYGAFYSEGTKICTYMIRDDTPELIMGYDNSLWYEIYFENGIAVNINTVAEMFDMCKYVGLDPVKYLGDVTFENAASSSYK